MRHQQRVPNQNPVFGPGNPRNQFNQQPWSQRFKKLGDEAEKVFENVANTEGWPFVRTGLNRPPLNMSRLSKMVCYTPDYLTDIHGYVEVQGFGKDRIFKLKDDKLDALMDWNMYVFQTTMFIWDNVPRRWAIVPIETIFDGSMPCNVTGEYPEGKKWMGWTADYLDVDWKPYGTI